MKYHLFDPALCWYTAAEMNMEGKHVQKSFKKKETTLVTEEQVGVVYLIKIIGSKVQQAE